MSVLRHPSRRNELLRRALVAVGMQTQVARELPSKLAKERQRLLARTRRPKVLEVRVDDLRWRRHRLSKGVSTP